MTIQTRIHDGINVKTRTYRNIYKGNLVDALAGFYAQKDFCKWGIMIKLKGNEHTELARFGKVEE